MKTFTLKLERSPVKKMFSELKRAVRTGVSEIHGDELLCSSIDAMMGAISKSRFEAFAAIVEHKPTTLRELANILDKNLGNVSRDVKSLELIGLVELRRDTTGNRVRPIAKYDQIVFDFSTPVRRAIG